MIVICAYCKVLIRILPGNAGAVSHGMCPKCLKEAMAAMVKEQKGA